MQRVIIIVIFYLFIISCGYIENDNIDYQKSVVGKIKIQKQENSNIDNLVFADTDEIFSVIVNDCLTIYYDSTSSKIFAEELLNNTHRTYYQITIKDPMGTNISKAVSKVILDRDLFNERTKEMKVWWRKPE